MHSTSPDKIESMNNSVRSTVMSLRDPNFTDSEVIQIEIAELLPPKRMFKMIFNYGIAPCPAYIKLKDFLTNYLAQLWVHQHHFAVLEVSNAVYVYEDHKATTTDFAKRTVNGWVYCNGILQQLFHLTEFVCDRYTTREYDEKGELHIILPFVLTNSKQKFSGALNDSLQDFWNEYDQNSNFLISRRNKNFKLYMIY